MNTPAQTNFSALLQASPDAEWHELPKVAVIPDPFNAAPTARETTEAHISHFLARAGTVTLERWAEADPFPSSAFGAGLGQSYWSLLVLLGSPGAHDRLRDLLEEELLTRKHLRAVEAEEMAAAETAELWEVANA